MLIDLIKVQMVIFTTFTQLCFSQTFLTNPLLLVKRPDRSVINFYLQIKDKEKPGKKLLVILQGSDCNSVRNNASINRLTGVCPDADLLLVEKYGITEQLDYSNDIERKDCPESYILNDNPEQRVKDIENVLTSVRKKFRYKKIIVVGGSEGSLVASILSSRVEYLSATVLFGAGGRYFLDDVIHSIKFTSQDMDTVNKNIEGFKQLSQHILTQEPFQFSMSNHGYAWWKSMLSIDREMQLSKIKIPVLLIQGGADQSASPEKATEMWKNLQEKGINNIEYKLYQEYNHSLNLTINDNTADKFIADIKEWLESKIGK